MLMERLEKRVVWTQMRRYIAIAMKYHLERYVAYF